MDARDMPLDKFIDLMGQDCGFKIQPYHRDILKAVAGSKRVIISWPRAGRNWIMEKQHHVKFWVALKSLIEHFNSDHPWDKSIVQKLMEGGMSKEEIKKFRELTLKASKAYYGKH